MVKVLGLNEVAKMADKEALKRRIEKEFLQGKIAEAIASGLDKQTASAMVHAMWECGVYSC